MWDGMRARGVERHSANQPNQLAGKEKYAHPLSFATNIQIPREHQIYKLREMLTESFQVSRGEAR
jgi:hypothetical protein